MIAKKNPNNVFSLFQQTNNTKNKPNQTNNSHFNKKEHTHDDVVLCYREKKKMLLSSWFEPRPSVVTCVSYH